MRILDKYILKNTVSSYVFIVLVLIGLYYVVDVFSTLSDILNAKPPISIVGKYYLYMLPLIFLRISPFALLVGVLYNFGELNKNNELVSLRCTGLSIIKIASPVIIFSICISFFALFLQEKVLINSQKKVEDIKIQFIKKDISAMAEGINLSFHSGHNVFFVRKFSPKNKTMEDVIFFEENNKENITRKTICDKMVYENKKWLAFGVIEYNLDDKGNIAEAPITLLKKEISELEETPAELALKKTILAQYDSLKNLKKERKRLKKINALNLLTNLTITYHTKLAEPFSHFFIIISILPIALEIKKRKVALSSLGIGFMFGFVYYSFTSFSVALGRIGLILPILSAWITPLFFLTVGLSALMMLK